MRCLQCGKDLPLFKRLASSEFCSEAHRREYQQEYSQLALGRLMQANPAESQAHPLKKTPLVSPSAQEIVESPATTAGVTAAPADAKPSVPPAGANTAAPPEIRAMPAATPNKIVEAPPPVAIPAKNAASEPATAPAAAVDKPTPAAPKFAPMGAPEFEHAFASLAPGKPRHQADVLRLDLPHGPVVGCESLVEIADSVARTIEHKLDLREMSRPTPRIALDLRIVPPESLEPGKPPLAIPVTPAEPAEASLWMGPHWDFVGELVSLSDFADAQFSKSGFEVPAGESFAVSAVAVESEPSPQETGAVASDSPTALNPLPVSSAGIAPGKAKPLPVFGPVPVPTGATQIPQPTGLPLRPLMVLAGTAAPIAEVERRKGDVLSLHSALPIKPELQQTKTSAAPSGELNLGLPELRRTPAGPMASRIRKILGGLTGAMVLGAGIFFFLGKPSDAGLKSPTPALADDAPGGQWIANFAPDARRQRRVSLLRSSIKLPSYRLDFESSIRIKALGWVYRAQDSKNFYVSKIEFQKPGQNPVYALLHFAVINGVEQPRVETPLHVPVPMGGVYKIRFEAAGYRFTTWVQGQRVEQWTDARLSHGGTGLYSEGSEQAALHGDFLVTPLSKEK